MSENETTNTSSLRGASTSQYDVAVSSTRDTSTVGGIISHNNAIRMAITPLMCVEVAAIVPPSHQALLRCAGSVGADVYEELVARGKAPLYIECKNSLDTGAVTTHRVPTTLPITSDTEPVDACEWPSFGSFFTNHPPDPTSSPTNHNQQHPLLDMAVLVVTHEYLASSSVSGQRAATRFSHDYNDALNAVKIYPVRRVRYISGGGETGSNWFSAIGSGFKKLESIEFCEVENMRRVPDQFMYNCPSLTSVDLSPFRNVTSIGRSFLFACAALKSIDLSPLSNVTEIEAEGGGFMTGCSSLTSIDLSPLSKITTLCGFLEKCSSLTAVDFTPLRNIKKVVAPITMCECTALTEIKLIASICPASGSMSPVLLPPGFMYFCSSLKSIDLSPFADVTEVGSDFMVNCRSLTSIDITPFANVTKIGQQFMLNCSSLTSIDLSPFSNVVTIGRHFMYGCRSLTTIDLTPLVKLAAADTSFMASCKALNKSMQMKFIKEVAARNK